MWNLIFCTLFTYVLYLILGGGIFMLLDDFKAVNVTISNKTVDFSKIESILLEKNFSEEQITEIIEGWRPEKRYGYFSDELQEEDPSWSFFNSFMFAFHLCSSIGYGDIAPATAYGQIICILYGIFGLPINTLFYKVLGASYADAFQETTDLVQGRSKSKIMQLAAVLSFFVPCLFAFIFVPATVFMYTDGWPFIDGVYYSIITLTTIGLGDYVGGNNLVNNVWYFIYKIALLIWMMHGLAFFSMLLDALCQICKRSCLYTIKLNWKKRKIEVFRVLVDIEKLDLHYRLLKSVGTKHRKGISHQGQTRRVKDYNQKHLTSLADVADILQSLIVEELQKRGSEKARDSLPKRKEVEKERPTHVPIRHTRSN